MKSKEKIAESLIELMKKQPYEEITIKEITSKAEVYRSTYYRNYKSKEAIIKYKIETIMDEYLENYKKITQKNKKTYLYTIFTTFKKHEEFFKIIHQQKQSYLIQQVLEEYFTKNRTLNNKEEYYKTYYHIGGINGFIICWINNNMKETPEELTDIALKTTDITPILMKK
ncbi:MAG: TetR/AcrR family transcriptional regulator [Methanosphaera sp.]|nr:TetR/AcrR family transcriptional regulator [Methanosphaera sp.]